MSTIPHIDDDFTCSWCGETYEQCRPQSEVLAEYVAMFPDASLDEVEIVCDDCFRLLTGELRDH